MAHLELVNVSYTYPNGFQALEDVSMEIDSGERVAIVGQNGAGKTTTAKLMNGLNKPTSGDVIVDGWNTKEYSTAKISQKIGYVFQNPDDQIFHNDVYQEIAFGPKNLKLSTDEVDENVRSAAKLMKIEDLLQENPHDLPLSIRKFVSTASIVAMNPDIIILDEPTAGQDRYGLECLAEAIQTLSESGKTVITITHDMEFVARNFTRTIVMAHKNKIGDGQTREIFWTESMLQEAGLRAPHISRLSKHFGVTKDVLNIDDFIANFNFKQN